MTGLVVNNSLVLSVYRRQRKKEQRVFFLLLERKSDSHHASGERHWFPAKPSLRSKRTKKESETAARFKYTMLLRLRPHDVSPVLSSLAVLASLACTPTMTASFSILDVLALTDRSCPTGCPLCQCINATESTADACTRARSIEACASDALDECFAGSLGGGDVNVAGLCAVQCGDGGGGQQTTQDLQRAFQCRLCDIFACCSDCPSERASECFPPNDEDGYTPTRWEPLSCDGSSTSSGGGGNSSGGRRAVEFKVVGSVSLMLAAYYFATTSIIV